MTIKQTVGGILLEKDGLIYVWLKGNDFIRVFNYVSTQACFSEEFGYIPSKVHDYAEETFLSLVESNHEKLKADLTSMVNHSIEETTRKTYSHIVERKVSGLKNNNPTTVRRMQIKMDVTRAAGILSEEELNEIESKYTALAK